MLNFFSKKQDSENKPKKLGWFNRFALVLNVLAVISILISYLARYISPAKFWLIAFFGLGYPVLFLINLLFIFYWTLQLKKQFLFSLTAIIIGYQSFFSYYQISFTNEKSNSKGGLKIMSYNCMLFDLYNWNHNKDSRKKIFKILADEQPDILCLQEFFTSENPLSFDNLSDLKKSLGFSYHHKFYTTTLREVDHWGIVTFSKYPIIKSGVLEFNTRTNNACIFSDVLIGNDTIRIYNLHLQSIQLGKENAINFSDINEGKENNRLKRVKNILRRLKRGFISRSEQAEMISKHISECRYKIILCGDFNDTPTSYAYHLVRGNLLDAFMEKGNGLEKTYNGKFPAFRIDNIFHSKEIKTLYYEKLESNLTDHCPVLAEIDISSN